MAKSRTLSFRPNDWEAKAIDAAEHATGRKRSELLRRCVAKALPAVVAELNAEHDTRVLTFHQVLKEAPVPYPISKPK